MGNSITALKQYVNNQNEHLAMFERNNRLADFLVRPTVWNGRTFSYDKYSFGDYSMGTFNNGVSQKDFTCERVEKVLSQDRGDSLSLDIRDKNEGQVVDGLAGMYNFYQMKVEVPTVEKYCLAQIVASTNGLVKSATGSLTTSNILSEINKLFVSLKNKRIKTEECVLLISTTAKALLDEAVFGKGIIKIGEWNGNANANTEIYKGAKIVEIDDTTMQGANFVLAHPYSFSLLDVLGIVNVLEVVPGKPGIAQIDIRDYFDAWIEPNADAGIAVALEKPNKVVATKDTTKVKITDVQPGAKVYYKTSSGASSSDTEVVASDGKYEFTGTASTTYYIVQYIGTVKSEEVSLAF